MKLYTEEQLHKLIIKYRQNLTEFSLSKPSVQNLIDELTPVTLPTDEEITHEGLFDYASQFGEHCDPAGYNDKQVDRWNGFYDGATYVINKIKGIQNEK